MSRCLASAAVSRPDGMALQGLLTASSSMDPGWNWLSMSKNSRLSQFQSITWGIRKSMVTGSGEGFVVKREPDSAVEMPSKVSGTTTDFISLAVKSQRVCRW